MAKKATKKATTKTAKKTAKTTKPMKLDFRLGTEEDDENEMFLYIEGKLPLDQKKLVEKLGFEIEPNEVYMYIDDLGKDLEAAEKKLKKLGKKHNFDFTITKDELELDDDEEDEDELDEDDELDDEEGEDEEDEEDDEEGEDELDEEDVKKALKKIEKISKDLDGLKELFEGMLSVITEEDE